MALTPVPQATRGGKQQWFIFGCWGGVFFSFIFKACLYFVGTEKDFKRTTSLQSPSSCLSAPPFPLDSPKPLFAITYLLSIFVHLQGSVSGCKDFCDFYFHCYASNSYLLLLLQWVSSSSVEFGTKREHTLKCNEDILTSAFFMLIYQRFLLVL